MTTNSLGSVLAIAALKLFVILGGQLIATFIAIKALYWLGWL